MGILAWHILYTWLVRLFSRDPKTLRNFFLEQAAKHSRWAVRVLNLELVIKNPERLRPGQNYLIVANHMSYIDALVIAAWQESAFVTSVEVKNMPFLGLITELAGCLYVERRSKDNIHNEIYEIEEALQQGFHVTFFPEATSTNGTNILPFKRPLFAAAVKTRKPVLPIVIQYESINGEAVTAKNRDYLCWYGDMNFTQHFLQLARLKNIRISLNVCQEIPVTESSTRDTLMETAYKEIKGQYRPVP